jgi:hypothetical protein
MLLLGNSNPKLTIQLLLTIGTLIVAGVAIVYSVIFVSGRVVTPRSISRRLRSGIIAAMVVIALAALNIFLTILPN